MLRARSGIERCEPIGGPSTLDGVAVVVPTGSDPAFTAQPSLLAADEGSHPARTLGGEGRVAR